MDKPLKKRPFPIRYAPHLLAVAAFLALLGYSLSVALKPKQMTVSRGDIGIAEAENGKFLEYIDVEGVVQPILTLKVNSMESGFVSRILKEEGAMLSKGDTILVLTNPELLRTIDDEQDEWERQQRSCQEQQIEMRQRSLTLRQQWLDAEHEMAALEKKLAIAREEFGMGIKSRAELDMAEEEYLYKKRKTELQLQSLRHDSVAASVRQQLIESDVARADKRRASSQERINRLVVTAPCDGQLSYLAATPGQQIASGTAIGEIKVMSSYKIHTSLNEYYIDRISVGLPASINEFPLRVSKVVPEVKDRSFDADLVFTGSQPESIKIGKSFRVKIELGKPETALIIPRGDFYNATGGQWIYRLSADGATAIRVPISIGRQNPKQYEVTSGLQPGDRVITTGYEKFGDVERIEIK